MFESVNELIISAINDINTATDIEKLRSMSMELITIIEKFNLIVSLEREKNESYKKIGNYLLETFDKIDKQMDGTLSNLPTLNEVISNARAAFKH